MQILAMLTMLIDHVGVIFRPESLEWRLLGRLAFPLYAFLLVQGYLYTSSLKRYLRRLFYIFSVAQLPYVIAFNKFSINVVGTLLVCLLVLFLIDRLPNQWLAAGIVAGCIALLDVLPFEYGSYALLLILIFRYASFKWIVPLHLLLNVVFVFYLGWTIQLFSIAATACIIYFPYLYRLIDKIRINRLVWRSFYPTHLIILAVIKMYT